MWWACFTLWWFVLTASHGSLSQSDYGDTLPAANINLPFVNHPLNQQLLVLVKQCALNPAECDANNTEIIRIGARLANEHAILLLHDLAEGLFDDILYFLDESLLISSRLAHMAAVLAFSQGKVAETRRYRSRYLRRDMVMQRSQAAHDLIIGDNDMQTMQLLKNYSSQLEESFCNAIIVNRTRSHCSIERYPPNEEQDEFLLSLLLSEAQGGVRTLVKVGDLPLAHFGAFKPLDERFRFRLGIGLTKLGLYDLSLRHVGLAATPWESPLFRLRAKLVFSPVHSSIGALAMAVNSFERQIESILMHPPVRNAQMLAICASLNEAALALQALPLLHVVGFASPTAHAELGHLPTPLPVLLSEVYLRICPPELPPDTIRGTGTKLTVGVMAGSMDGAAGKIMIGILDGLTANQRRKVEFVALCFPTARSAVTDKLTALFNSHVNLVPDNKQLTMDRILAKHLDVLVFADASSDGRVFALAHERLAVYQTVLWNWGGTLGIPSVDFYIMPDIFLRDARCKLSDGELAPHSLFREQLILLEGLPSLPTTLKLVTEDLWQIMRTRYLLEASNRTHIYFIPSSVKFLHPQFDRAIEVILSTDHIAIVVLAVVRTGRDSLPTTHIAVRHDLLHPAMPPAAVAQCVARLRGRLGDEVRRVRFLPPLEEPVFRALQMQAVAVLDPFPVGLHEPVLDAMLDGVPVVSSSDLQECTNSHAAGIGRYLKIPAFLEESQSGGLMLPSTAEDYGVLAVRLAKDRALRRSFIMPAAGHAQHNEPSHATQLLGFFERLVNERT